MVDLIIYAIPAFVLLAVEMLNLARDVRGARNWRERFGYVFRGPGWSPDGSGGGTRG